MISNRLEMVEYSGRGSVRLKKFIAKKKAQNDEDVQPLKP